MTKTEIIKYRLLNQQIAETKFTKPNEIVAWLAAMQSQEFAMAKWAIGLRLKGLKDADVEKAFNKGEILRTHILRPTWHFITPKDICWMLALTAPRVNAFNKYYYRKYNLDNKIFKRCNDTFIKILEGGKQLTRTALKSALERVKVKADGIRLGLIMMKAELDGIICSGARIGKQFSYALLKERAPGALVLRYEEALTELTIRYFKSRGPAAIQDFVWWSGLSNKEAKAGIAMLDKEFTRETIDGKEYIFSTSIAETFASGLTFKKNKLQTTFLMPDYDEYGISYKDRSAIFTAKNVLSEPEGGNNTYSHALVIDGRVAGTWKRYLKNNTVAVETTFFTALNKRQQEAVKKAVKTYRTFFW